MKESQEVLDALSQKKIKEVYEILLKAGIQMESGESNIFKRIEILILWYNGNKCLMIIVTFNNP